MSTSSKSTAVAGIVISALVIAAIASIGYFQVQVAPKVFTTPSISTSSTSSLSPGQYVNVTMPNFAGTPPPGWSPGTKTQYGYTPDVITVVIGKNNTINFVNDDITVHTATSDTAGVFDTGNIAPGASAQLTLTTPGTYTYRCIYHAWMQGTIIVKSA